MNHKTKDCKMHPRGQGHIIEVKDTSLVATNTIPKRSASCRRLSSYNNTANCSSC